MIIEYELRCNCGIIKHDRTRMHILEWWLEHKKQEGNHEMKLLWFVNNKFRMLNQEEIQEFIEYIQSGKSRKNEQQNPWGLEGLGFHNNLLE